MLCLILTLAAVGLSACSNTFKGVGKDIRKIGQSVEDTF